MQGKQVGSEDIVSMMGQEDQQDRPVIQKESSEEVESRRPVTELSVIGCPILKFQYILLSL